MGIFVTVAAVLTLAGAGSGGDATDAGKLPAAQKPAAAAPARPPAPKRTLEPVGERADKHRACDTRWMYTDDPAAAWVRHCW
jgi:hypothetical protein